MLNFIIIWNLSIEKFETTFNDIWNFDFFFSASKICLPLTLSICLFLFFNRRKFLQSMSWRRTLFVSQVEDE